MTNNDELAKRLIARRAEMEWSQEELSKQSGVAAAQISRYESGKSKPRPNIIKKLSSALMVPFDWLAYGDESQFQLVGRDEEKGLGPMMYLDLPDDLLQSIEEEASELGIPFDEMVIKILTSAMDERSSKRTTLTIEPSEDDELSITHKDMEGSSPSDYSGLIDESDLGI